MKEVWEGMEINVVESALGLVKLECGVRSYPTEPDASEDELKKMM